MEIGGIDFTFSCPMTHERLQKALEVTRLRWPAACFEDDSLGTFSDCVGAPAIPCWVFVYRTAEAFDAVERDGVTEALEDELFSMYVDVDALHFVVGNVGSEADRIRQDIEHALRGLDATGAQTRSAHDVP